MLEEIKLGKKTIKLIAKLQKLENCAITIPELQTTNSGSSMNAAEAIAWLRPSSKFLSKSDPQDQQVPQDQKYLLESLNLSILTDLYTSIRNDTTKKSAEDEEKAKKDKEDKGKPDWFSTLKFILLAIAGTIVFGCEGFDGIMAILNITSLPTLAIFVVGLVFSLFSVAVFYACDLVDISKNLGVNLSSAPKMVDVYLQETGIIKDWRKEINAGYFEKNRDGLAADIALLEMLQARYAALDTARDALKKAPDSPALLFFRYLAASAAGVLLFCGGFFAGQTVSIAVAGLFMAVVTPTFWPVLVASFVVGLAALSVYWFVQRPAFEHTMGRWVGLDKDSIETLCNPDKVDKEKGKLNVLLNNLRSRSNALTEIGELKAERARLQINDGLEIEHAPIGDIPPYRKRTQSYSSFFKPACSHHRFNDADFGLQGLNI